MSGWKTVSAGLLTIVYGIAGTVVGLHDPATGFQYVVAGLAVLGIGHKLDKVADTLKDKS